MENNFSKLGISKEMEDKLKMFGIKEPTPIQREAIPQLLKGKDVMGRAHTGTGKTLAFLLPLMEKIDSEKEYVQGLIVAPTRELAIQIASEAKKIANVKDISILSVYGGQDVEKQIRKLKNGVDLVIATPGRLLDHVRRKTIDLSRTSMFVIDEADEILRMGFLVGIEDIIGQIHKTNQTMLFSATMPAQVRALARRYMKNAQYIDIKEENIVLEEIEQLVIETTDRSKQEELFRQIDKYNPFLAIVFCRTKRRVKQLTDVLAMKGYNCDEIHGDLSQAKRERVMKRFREAKIQILVATDIAARGLDVEGVTHVFNYDIPENAEDYIHRIGRTGRIGKDGMAITFVTEKNKDDLAAIERNIKLTLKKQTNERKKKSRSPKKREKSKEKESYDYKEEYKKRKKKERYSRNKK